MEKIPLALHQFLLTIVNERVEFLTPAYHGCENLSIHRILGECVIHHQCEEEHRQQHRDETEEHASREPGLQQVRAPLCQAEEGTVHPSRVPATLTHGDSEPGPVQPSCVPSR